VALVGASAVAATALHGTAAPPALDKMALVPADLASGGVVRREGYVRNRNFSAYYVREFATGAVVGYAHLSSLESDVGLAASAADAARLASTVSATLRTRSGRRSFARSALADAGWDPAGMVITVASLKSVAAGDAASLTTMRLALPGRRRFALVLGLTRVERALQLVYLLGAPNTSIASAEVARLVDVVAGRMRAGLVPAATTAPTISGAAAAGQLLTAEPGAWTNTPTSFAFHWLRCDPAGGGCSAIDGTSASSYLLTPADVGSTIEVSVVASNNAGPSAPAVSANTAVVVASAAGAAR
jgi:hypothetical protein